MSRTAGKTAKIAAVDEIYPARKNEPIEFAGGGMERLLHAHDERWLRNQIRRERSGAYWFAATKWGITGLVVGMIIGGAGMFVATLGTIELAQDAIAKAQVLENVRRESEQVPGDFTTLPTDPSNQ